MVKRKLGLIRTGLVGLVTSLMPINNIYANPDKKPEDSEKTYVILMGGKEPSSNPQCLARLAGDLGDAYTKLKEAGIPEKNITILYNAPDKEIEGISRLEKELADPKNQLPNKEDLKQSLSMAQEAIKKSRGSPAECFIKETVREIIWKNPDKNNRLIVYISSHGSMNRQGSCVYLPRTGNFGDRDTISDSDLYKMLKPLTERMGNSLIVVDACYAEGFAKKFSNDNNVVVVTSTSQNVGYSENNEESTKRSFSNAFFYFLTDKWNSANFDFYNPGADKEKEPSLKQAFNAAKKQYFRGKIPYEDFNPQIRGPQTLVKNPYHLRKQKSK